MPRIKHLKYEEEVGQAKTQIAYKGNEEIFEYQYVLQGLSAFFLIKIYKKENKEMVIGMLKGTINEMKNMIKEEKPVNNVHFLPILDNIILSKTIGPTNCYLVEQEEIDEQLNKYKLTIDKFNGEEKYRLPIEVTDLITGEFVQYFLEAEKQT